MKAVILGSFFSFLFFNQSTAQCKNLTFEEIYSLWISYSNKTIKESLEALGAIEINENTYGICYTLIPESKSDSIYNYNELFLIDQSLRFSYGTFNKEAYLGLKNYVLNAFTFMGSYLERGVKFRVYYHPTYKYCILSEMNSGLSPNYPIFLYDLEIDNLKPPYSLQTD